MDFGKLDVAKAAENASVMTVNDPRTGAPAMGADGNPLTITLRGAEGPTFKRSVANAVAQNKGKKKISPEAQAESSAGVLADITVDWSDNWMWDGEPFPFSHENAKKLYRKHAWLRRDVDEYIGEIENFTEPA